ncbi:hypothetical protein TMatcc_002782 [Talaromyces marneffei ATCC 18224]
MSRRRCRMPQTEPSAGPVSAQSLRLSTQLKLGTNRDNVGILSLSAHRSGPSAALNRRSRCRQPDTRAGYIARVIHLGNYVLTTCPTPTEYVQQFYSSSKTFHDNHALQIPDLSLKPSFHVQDLNIKKLPSTRPLFPPHVCHAPTRTGIWMDGTVSGLSLGSINLSWSGQTRESQGRRSSLRRTEMTSTIDQIDLRPNVSRGDEIALAVVEALLSIDGAAGYRVSKAQGGSVAIQLNLYPDRHTSSTYGLLSQLPKLSVPNNSGCSANSTTRHYHWWPLYSNWRISLETSNSGPGDPETSIVIVLLTQRHIGSKPCARVVALLYLTPSSTHTIPRPFILLRLLLRHEQSSPAPLPTTTGDDITSSATRTRVQLRSMPI